MFKSLLVRSFWGSLWKLLKACCEDCTLGCPVKWKTKL